MIPFHLPHTYSGKSIFVYNSLSLLRLTCGAYLVLLHSR